MVVSMPAETGPNFIDIDFLKLVYPPIPEAYFFIYLMPEDQKTRWMQLGHVSTENIENSLLRSGRADRDSHLSVNLYRIPHCGRKAKNLQYLVANFIDLDFHEKGLNKYEIGMFLDALIDQGHIPHPSVIVRTGHGLFLLWLLGDEVNRNVPPRAKPGNQNLWHAINHALFRKLQHLGADHRALDVTHTTRLVGSYRTTTRTTVVHQVQFVNGEIPRYTLYQMASKLGVKVAVRKKDDDTGRPKNPDRQKGYFNLLRKNLERFEKLRTLRGDEFLADSYGKNLMLYCALLFANRYTEERIYKMLDPLVEDGIVSMSTLNHAVDNGKSFRFFRPNYGGLSYEKIGNWLDLTVEEHLALDGKWPPASQFGYQKPQEDRWLDQQAEYINRRQNTMRSLISELGYTPSLRKMSELLANKGFKLSKSQVANEYECLSIERKHKVSSPPTLMVDTVSTYQVNQVGHLTENDVNKT